MPSNEPLLNDRRNLDREPARSSWFALRIASPVRNLSVTFPVGGDRRLGDLVSILEDCATALAITFAELWIFQQIEVLGPGNEPGVLKAALGICAAILMVTLVGILSRRTAEMIDGVGIMFARLGRLLGPVGRVVRTSYRTIFRRRRVDREQVMSAPRLNGVRQRVETVYTVGLNEVRVIVPAPRVTRDGSAGLHVTIAVTIRGDSRS